MVDADSIYAKLGRLDSLLGVLEQARGRGHDALIADIHLQLEVERALQVSIQIAIDIGAHLVSELGLKPPTDYRGIFDALRGEGILDATLADRLGTAAGLRNLLVHDYGEIDHRRLWASLDDLDDLRAFAEATERRVRERD